MDSPEWFRRVWSTDHGFAARDRFDARWKRCTEETPPEVDEETRDAELAEEARVFQALDEAACTPGQRLRRREALHGFDSEEA